MLLFILDMHSQKFFSVCIIAGNTLAYLLLRHGVNVIAYPYLIRKRGFWIATLMFLVVSFLCCGVFYSMASLAGNLLRAKRWFAEATSIEQRFVTSPCKWLARFVSKRHWIALAVVLAFPFDPTLTTMLVVGTHAKCNPLKVFTVAFTFSSIYTIVQAVPLAYGTSVLSRLLS